MRALSPSILRLTRCCLALVFAVLALATARADDRSLTAVAAPAEKRVALIIAAANYRNITPLKNPPSDARLMADTLKSVGFELVSGGPLIDADKNAMEKAIRDFGRMIRGGAVGLFYYSGHGVQIKGQNYLIPVTANISSESDVKYELVDAGFVLDEMAQAGNKLNIVILDACRNNPFGGRGMRSAGSGLAQVTAPEGTVISYATQPGATASDGAGINSPYTEALAAAIKKPGMDVFATFNDVGLKVKQVSGGQQQPWLATSPIEGGFVFSRANAPAPNSAPSAQPSAPQIPSAAAAATANVNSAQPRLAAFRDCPNCPEMVQLPAGTFTMGSSIAETAREGVSENNSGREKPPHPVSVNRAFAMSKYPVTRGEFLAFAQEMNFQIQPCLMKQDDKWVADPAHNLNDPGFAQTDRHPAVCVSFNDAKKYVAWLSSKTGKSYRLPSEAEWEYAARAGSVTARYWGDARELACDYANVADMTGAKAMNWTMKANDFQCSDGSARTAPVGSYRPNAFGLYDMLGNVRSLVEDCWHESYQDAPGDAAPWTANADCSHRTVRGSAWSTTPVSTRAAARTWNSAGFRENITGFRVVRE